MDNIYKFSQVLTWPKLNLEGIFLTIIFIALFGLVFRLLFLYWSKNQFYKQLWYTLYERAVKRGLSQKEIHLLSYIFSGLNPSIKRLSIKPNSTSFQSELLKRFTSQTDIPVTTIIQIFEKLFLETKNHGLLRNISDLQMGEYCGVEFKNRHYLGVIQEIGDKKLIIRTELPHTTENSPSSPYSTEIHHTTNKLGGELSIYFYRPETGSYSTKTKVIDYKESLLHLECYESLIYKGDGHIMANLKLSVTIFPSPIAKHILDEDVQENPLSFSGITSKISERAFLFQLQNSSVDNLILELEPLEANILLNEGNVVNCIGKVIRSEIISYSYIFKITYINPEDKTKLSQEILNNNPVKENIG